MAARLAFRAGWAPLVVFLLYETLSGWVINLYALYPRLDVPTHFLGGMAVAHFLSTGFAALPEDVILFKVRPLAEAVIVMSLTATASMGWEFVEYASDNLLGTHMQFGLDDTMRDMAFGILGGTLILLVRFWRGRLGAPDPVVPFALGSEGRRHRPD